MDTSRLLIAILLSLGLIYAYQELVLKKMYPPPSEKQTQEIPGSPLAEGSPGAMPSGAAAAPSAPGAVEAPAALAPAPGSIGAEKLVTVETSLYRAVFTSQGARLKSFRLKDYRETVAPSSPPYEMVQPSSGGQLPLGLLVNSGTATADDHALDYSTDSPASLEVAGDQPATLRFDAETSDGTKIEKTFTFESKRYAFAMTAAVDSAKPPVAIGLVMMQPLTERGEGYYDLQEIEADVQDKVMNDGEKALRKGVAPVIGRIIYAGFGDRYFLTAYLPQNPTVGMLTMDYSGADASARLVFADSSRLSTQVYVGPKKLEALEAVSPLLTKSINFGWTGVLALSFLRILKIFHHLDSNWGWDIILLTIALRVMMLPMSIRSQRSMIRMQRLQPQMERLRAQFKDDPDRLNKEMVDLYKRNHVNPIGGCAPMIIQLPVFIGLYEALLNTVELRHAPFIFWIKDLSAPDCFPIAGLPKLPYIHCQGIPVLVLAMGISAFLQQRMMPTQPDANQQRMMMLSPVIFTIFLVNFPAGLSLYYFASNMLGVIQQFFLNREFRQTGPVTT